MSGRNDFLAYILDCMAEASGGPGPVQAVRFFGGTGLKVDGRQFAMITRSSRLYFVVDDISRPRYEAAGMTPFSYARKTGQREVRRYYELPEDVLMDGEALGEWMREALAVVQRTAKKSRRKPGRI